MGELRMSDTQDLHQRHQSALKDIEAHNCGDELCQSGMKPCTKLAALFAEVKWLKTRLVEKVTA